MKLLIGDQMLFLLIGIVIATIIPCICGPVFTILLEMIVLFSWGYLCRRILLIPFDFLLGNSSQTVYFASQCGIYEYEFFKTKYSPLWKFNSVDGQAIILLVPDLKEVNEDSQSYCPKQNKKVNISYLRLSKILLSWNYTYENT